MSKITYEDKAKDFFDKQDNMMLEHEAGHMVLLKSYFPNNTFSYGINEQGLPCVIDTNSYDFEDVYTNTIHLMVDFAGIASVCKHLDFSKHETVKFITQLISSGKSGVSDIEKADKVLQLLKKAGNFIDYEGLIGVTYDMLDLDKIKEEVKIQKNIFPKQVYQK